MLVLKRQRAIRIFEYGIGIMIPLLLDKGFAEKTWIPLNAYPPRHVCLAFEKHT